MDAFILMTFMAVVVQFWMINVLTKVLMKVERKIDWLAQAAYPDCTPSASPSPGPTPQMEDFEDE
jgi:hypothetical protein